MKQKTEKKFSQRDLLNEYQKLESPLKKQSSIKDDNLSAFNIDLESTKKYNENLLTLDPLYAELNPLAGYIVRVFLNEPTITESGLLVPYRQVVSVPTQNGMADYAEVETPFPYSNKAVIVAAPSHSQSVKQGDIVQLGNNPVKTQVVGQAKNAMTSVPAAYMHPDSQSLVIPTDMNSRHYGYLLISINDILVKLTNNQLASE